MKSTKLLLSLCMTAVPIASIVSCSSILSGPNYERYETKNDKTVDIFSTWSSNGYQTKAMEKVVAKYNETQKNKPGFVKVAMHHAQGGYGDYIRSIIGTELKNKSSDIANIVIDYPAVAGNLSSVFQELDLHDVDPTIDTLWDKKAGKINDRIGGLKKGGAYTAPFAFSSEALSINGPLFNKVIKDIKDAGATVKLTGKMFEDMLGSDFSKEKFSVGDGEFKIKNTKMWEGFEVNNSTFESYKKLLEFSTMIAQAYDLKTTGDMHVLGNDAPTNMIYQMAYSIAKNKFSDFLFHNVESDNNYIKYHTDKPAVKAAAKAIIEAVDSGGLALFGGGTYGSADFVNHKLIFTIGSTAGYKHNFKDDRDKYTFKATVKAGNKFKDGVEVDFKYTGKVYKVGASGVKNKKPNKQAIAWFASGSHVNNLYASAAIKKEAKDKYGLALKEGVPQEIIDKIKNGEGYISSASQAEKAKGAIKISNGKHPSYYLGSESKIVQVDVDVTKVLNKNEMFAKIQPTTYDGGKEIMFKNGPSFIPIHNNDSEDKGTALFIRWFFEQKETKLMNDFMKKSGYIVTYNGFEKHDGFKDGNKIATDYLKGHKDIEMFQSPVDDTTGTFRKKMDSSIRAIYTESHTKIQTHNLSSIMKKIKSLVKQ